MSDFPREVMKHVVAQVCQSYNFTGIETSACDALIDLLQRYIEEIGYYSKTYAQHAGRTDCNVNDIFNGLAELSVSFEELKNHFSQSQEVLQPFDRTIPKIPIVQKSKKHKPLTDASVKPSFLLPHFAPFPEKHTYINTPILAVRETDLKEIQKKKLKERKQVQSGLSRIQESIGTEKISDVDVLNCDLLQDNDYDKLKASGNVFVDEGTVIQTDTRMIVEKYVKMNEDKTEYSTPLLAEKKEHTEEEGVRSKKMDEKQKARLEFILKLSHEGNTLSEVPASLLDVPPPVTIPTPPTRTNEPVGPGKTSFKQNIPTTNVQFGVHVNMAEMQQKAQIRSDIYK